MAGLASPTSLFPGAWLQGHFGVSLYPGYTSYVSPEPGLGPVSEPGQQEPWLPSWSRVNVSLVAVHGEDVLLTQQVGPCHGPTLSGRSKENKQLPC